MVGGTNDCSWGSSGGTVGFGGSIKPLSEPGLTTIVGTVSIGSTASESDADTGADCGGIVSATTGGGRSDHVRRRQLFL